MGRLPAYSLWASRRQFILQESTVQTHSVNTYQDRWLRGITALLKTRQIHSTQRADGRYQSPAHPGEIRRMFTRDPWLSGAEISCPDSIKDIEARRIYTAHQLCTDRTFARPLLPLDSAAQKTGSIQEELEEELA